jgi:hypothetical protein
MARIDPEALLPGGTGYTRLSTKTSPKTTLGKTFARLKHKRFFQESADVLGDLFNGYVLIEEDSDFEFWAKVVMCLSSLSFLVSLYLHYRIDQWRLDELEARYDELSEKDKERYPSEVWYCKVKDQRYYKFHDFAKYEAQLQIIVAVLEDVPSAVLNLFILFRSKSLTKNSTQVLVALQSVYSFANMLYETYELLGDAREPEPLNLKGHEDSVRSARAFADGKRIVTASEDKTAKVWSTVSGECLLTLTGHEMSLMSATVAPDVNDRAGVHTVLTASADGKVILHDRL